MLPRAKAVNRRELCGATLTDAGAVIDAHEAQTSCTTVQRAKSLIGGAFTAMLPWI
jgi:hypothetical protein